MMEVKYLGYVLGRGCGFLPRRSGPALCAVFSAARVSPSSLFLCLCYILKSTRPAPNAQEVVAYEETSVTTT